MLIRASLCICILSTASAAPAHGQTATTLPAEDRPLTATTEHLYSIGRFDGEAWEVFGSRLELEFGRDGSLYVLDRDNAVVHRFGADGRHQWSAGGSGSGPGELSAVATMAVLPRGDVVIADMAQARIERFTPDGRHAGTIAIPPGVRPRRIHAAGDSAVWFIPATSAAQGDSLPILHVTLAGRATVVRHVPVRGPAVMREGNVLRRIIPPTFAPALRTTAAGTRLVIVDGIDYLAHVDDDAAHEATARAGAEPPVLRRPMRPRAVTGADRDAARERLRRNARNAAAVTVNGFRVMPPSPAALEEQVRQMTFAETLPVIQDVLGSPDGTLWIARTGRVAFGPGPIDVIRPDMRYTGTLPSHEVPAAIGPNGLIATIELDELDVPVVRVSRVTFGG